jgi:hypothetical protein
MEVLVERMRAFNQWSRLSALLFLAASAQAEQIVLIGQTQGSVFNSAECNSSVVGHLANLGRAMAFVSRYSSPSRLLSGGPRASCAASGPLQNLAGPATQNSASFGYIGAAETRTQSHAAAKTPHYALMRMASANPSQFEVVQGTIGQAAPGAISTVPILTALDDPWSSQHVLSLGSGGALVVQSAPNVDGLTRLSLQRINGAGESTWQRSVPFVHSTSEVIQLSLDGSRLLVMSRIFGGYSLISTADGAVVTSGGTSWESGVSPELEVGVASADSDTFAVETRLTGSAGTGSGSRRLWILRALQAGGFVRQVIPLSDGERLRSLSADGNHLLTVDTTSFTARVYSWNSANNQFLQAGQLAAGSANLALVGGGIRLVSVLEGTIQIFARTSASSTAWATSAVLSNTGIPAAASLHASQHARRFVVEINGIWRAYEIR